MKVKFYLDSKPSKSGESTIWCYIREYDNTVALNTGERLHADLWDKRITRADLSKAKNKILQGKLNSLNQYLNVFENKIFDIIRSIRGKEFNAGFSKIADEIKRQFRKRETGFFSIYDEFLLIKKSEVSKKSLLKFNKIKTLLGDYEKASGEKLNFDKITPLFFSKFNAFLVDQKKYINNTAQKNIQFLKTFLIWANNNNYTNNTSYKSFKSKTEKNEIIYLTENELMTLYNFKSKEEKLNRVRDIFVFQCFTGVRYSDIENISREDIRNGTWTVRIQKTHQIIEIPLNSFALSILEKYREFPRPLPVISNQKMNSYLKDLCGEAKINEPVKVVKYKGSERIETVYEKYQVIGTHTARRTFISLSLQKGMKPDVIMAITGHSTYRMMQKYLKIADKFKREEMDKVWGINLRRII